MSIFHIHAEGDYFYFPSLLAKTIYENVLLPYHCLFLLEHAQDRNYCKKVD